MSLEKQYKAFMKVVNDVKDWKIEFTANNCCIATKNTKTKGLIMKSVLVMEDYEYKDTLNVILSESFVKDITNAMDIEFKILSSRGNNSDFVQCNIKSKNIQIGENMVFERYWHESTKTYILFGTSLIYQSSNKENEKCPKIELFGMHVSGEKKFPTITMFMEIDKETRKSKYYNESKCLSFYTKLLQSFMRGLQMSLIPNFTCSYPATFLETALENTKLSPEKNYGSLIFKRDMIL